MFCILELTASEAMFLWARCASFVEFARDAGLTLADDGLIEAASLRDRIDECLRYLERRRGAA